jgi:hypothetical protein
MQQGGKFSMKPEEEPSNNQLSYPQALLKNKLKGVRKFNWRGRQFRTVQDALSATRIPK